MKKSIEDTYQKKTPLEHVLLRPDTYVGSIQMQKSYKWVLPRESSQFKYKQITYVPALYKIFDQVLVNAADNYQRDRKMNLLKVQINQQQGYISVWNNGKGIPVAIHKQHKIYVPQLIFGHLLTGSNYNDDEKKVVGGRNGYGAKLANIFSRKFIVQCGDKSNGKKFRMTWSKNMTMHGQAEISTFKEHDFTSITFYPEFSRFQMQGMDNDIFQLLTKRVYDMAGLMPKVKVVFNGKDIPINSFVKYVNMYYQTETQIPKIRDNQVDNQRWQVVVSISEGQFRQVSFVNSICTTKGGTHVNFITEQIVQKIQQKIKKKDKNLTVKPFQIKAHLWIFVNCLIQNPTFDSQTKQTMTLKASQFGSTCQLSDKMIKQILKSGVVDEIFNQAKAKELSKLAKMTTGKKTNLKSIPKLEDANQAGTRNSQKCTLILTQGDSAKSLAMAGIQVIGRDYYGVFPLKGKLLNVRQASNKTLMENQEVQNIIKIIGLQIGKQYNDLKGLRYGALMIMSDQDTDGSHIKGLVINMIHYFWPSLFKMPGFVKQFITPLLKVTKGRQSVSFFTMSDYKRWSQGIQDLKRWKIKYYKGLGTSSDKEAQQYFSDLRKHKIDFDYIDTNDDQALEMVFGKKNVEKRKQWLSHYDPTVSMQYNCRKIRYQDFVNYQLIHFSNQDNVRSIASIIDGFKPGQRKIIFACFKRNLKDQIKVAQLSGYVAQHSAYHHGQMSLTQTIVGMAQNFVGSNNINLLLPNGQFGSRNAGGKDHASARYIFTCLNKITRYIYPQADDHTLTYIEDDGQMVEPQYYMPIIPMGLVNGCQGIGTGWSTYVPNFNPRQIAKIILEKLEQGTQFPDVHPWFKGWQGQLIPKSDGQNYEIKGNIEIDAQSSIIHIRQLPIGKWTKDYKAFLEQLMEKNPKIMGMRQYHTKNKVHFEIQIQPQLLQGKTDNIEYFEKLLKLTGNISMKNMVGFSSVNTIRRYSKVADVLEQFFGLRLQYYQKRKQYLLSQLQRDLEILSMKERFIIEVVQEKLVLRNQKRVKVCEILKAKGYIRFSDFTKIKTTKQIKGKESNKKISADAEQSDEQEDQNMRGQSKQFNYLLSMPLWNLTYEKVEQIKKKKKQKQMQLKELQNKKIESLWQSDLQTFLTVLEEVQKQEKQQIEKAAQRVKHDGKQKRVKKKAERVKKEKKKINWDSESQNSKSKQKAKPKAKKRASQQTQPKSKAKKNTKNNQVKKQKEPLSSKIKKQDNDNDLLNRVKKKLQEKSDTSENNNQSDFEMGVILRPKKKTKTIQQINIVDEEYDVVKVPKSKKKKSLVLDSDEQDYEESESWSDFADDD